MTDHPRPMPDDAAARDDDQAGEQAVAVLVGRVLLGVAAVLWVGTLAGVLWGASRLFGASGAWQWVGALGLGAVAVAVQMVVVQMVVTGRGLIRGTEDLPEH